MHILTHTRTQGVEWGAQVCALLPCAEASHQCLSYQTRPQSSYLTTFELTMTGANADTVVTPEVVAMKDANKQVRNVTTLS